MKRTPDDIQDELLVLRGQTGDREALATLLVRWRPRLMRFARRLTRDRHVARDAVQDTLLAVFRGLRRLDDPAAFRTWAFRIARHKCIDVTRRQATRREVSDGAIDDSVTPTAEPGDKTKTESESVRIRAALRQMSVEQRAVLSLHYLDGMHVREIAHVLELPAGTVKSRLFHAREQFKRLFERTTP